MEDPKLAIADKLTSQDGKNAIGKNADAHKRTLGATACNDAVESKFAAADYVMRTYRGISVLNASGIVQQRTAHDFDRAVSIGSDRRKRKAPAEEPRKVVGFFWALTPELRNSLIEMARHELPNALKVGREEKRSHDTEKLSRREEAVQRLLDSTVERYAAALELYDQWKAQRVTTVAALDRALDGLSEAEQVAELRRQIEMRTVALGWTEFETKWGYYADERKHKIADLRRILVDDIMPHERTMARLKKLPAAAVPPQLKPRALKVLGTEDVDALEATDIFNVDSLLVKAQAARARREAQGISDVVEATQPREAPPFDVRLVGKRLEICWPYKEQGNTVKIWASGIVKHVADGLTDKRSAKAKKVLPAGALLWAWEADPEYNEPAGERWMFLLPKRWNKHVQYAWRFDPCELGLLHTKVSAWTSGARHKVMCGIRIRIQSPEYPSFCSEYP